MSLIASASAPGKVVVCGEYAVLENYPCLVLAADRRVVVSLSKISKPGFWISSPGYRERAERVAFDDQFVFQCQQAHYQMLLRTLNALHFLPSISRALGKVDGLLLEIDSTALFLDGQKLGLGSSAALTCALYRLTSHFIEPTRSSCRGASKAPTVEQISHQWLALHRVHSEMQGKVGSGVDIAASLAGGYVQFRKSNDGSFPASIKRLSLPHGLAFAFIWAGESASTPRYLNKLKEWKAENAESYQHFMQRMGNSVKQIHRDHSVTDFLECVDEFSRTLYEFDLSSKLGIFEGGHDALYKRAKNYPGLIYKPCGAGGGDLGVALSHNPSVLDAFVSENESMGIARININLDPVGAVVEKTASSL